MNIDTLLSYFQRVRESGHGRYVARCSAHDDKNPSLSLSEGEGGRLLLKCWAGCETEDVLAAVGLTFSDVMPERVGTMHSYKPLKSPFDARQVLAAIGHELMVVCLVADRIAGIAGIAEDQERLIIAAARLNKAIDLCQTLAVPAELKRIRRAEA